MASTQVHPFDAGLKQDAQVSHMRADADHDGLISKDELDVFQTENTDIDMSWMDGDLAAYDLNNDGHIDADEWEAALARQKEKNKNAAPEMVTFIVPLLTHVIVIVVLVVIAIYLSTTFNIATHTLSGDWIIDANHDTEIRFVPGSGSATSFRVVGAYLEDSTPHVLFPWSTTYKWSNQKLSINGGKSQTLLIVEVTAPTAAAMNGLSVTTQNAATVAIDALDISLNFGTSAFGFNSEKGMVIAKQLIAGSANIAIAQQGGVQINDYQVPTGTISVGVGDVFIGTTSNTKLNYDQPHGLVCLSAPSQSSISQTCPTSTQTFTDVLTSAGCSGSMVLSTTAVARAQYAYEVTITASYGNLHTSVTSSVTPTTTHTRGYDNGTVALSNTSLNQLSLARAWIDEEPEIDSIVLIRAYNMGMYSTRTSNYGTWWLSTNKGVLQAGVAWLTWASASLLAPRQRIIYISLGPNECPDSYPATLAYTKESLSLNGNLSTLIRNGVSAKDTEWLAFGTGAKDLSIYEKLPTEMLSYQRTVLQSSSLNAAVLLSILLCLLLGCAGGLYWRWFYYDWLDKFRNLQCDAIRTELTRTAIEKGLAITDPVLHNQLALVEPSDLASPPIIETPVMLVSSVVSAKVGSLSQFLKAFTVKVDPNSEDYEKLKVRREDFDKKYERYCAENSVSMQNMDKMHVLLTQFGIILTSEHVQVYQCIKYHASHGSSARLLDMAKDPLKSFFGEHVLVTGLNGDMMRQEDFLQEYMLFYDSLGLENFQLDTSAVEALGAIGADAHLQSMYGFTFKEENKESSSTVYGEILRALYMSFFLTFAILIVTVPTPFLCLWLETLKTFEEYESPVNDPMGIEAALENPGVAEFYDCELVTSFVGYCWMITLILATFEVGLAQYFGMTHKLNLGDAAKAYQSEALLGEPDSEDEDGELTLAEMVQDAFHSKERFIVRSRALSNYVLTSIVCIFLCLLCAYIVLVLEWCVLGAILNPNRFLPLGASVLTLITVVGAQVAMIRYTYMELYDHLMDQADKMLNKQLLKNKLFQDEGDGAELLRIATKGMSMTYVSPSFYCELSSGSLSCVLCLAELVWILHAPMLWQMFQWEMFSTQSKEAPQA